MSFSFLAGEMVDDLRALANGASTFLAPRSSDRMKALAQDLLNGVANAKATAVSEFRWGTRDASPIEIRESQNWKGTSNDFERVAAAISLGYACSLADEGRVGIREGSAVIKIRMFDDDSREKVIHFDSEQGGWNQRAGHPPFHAQFYGRANNIPDSVINDLPRLPSLIVHPLDVINFAILELHQSHWREHVQQVKPRSELRHFPARQRVRLQAIANRWAYCMTNNKEHGLVLFQRQMPEPLAL